MTGAVAGRLLDRVLTPQEARAIASWSCTTPLDPYDLPCDDAVTLLTTRDAGEVPGTVDVGAGPEPGRLGRGLATRLSPEVVRFAVERFRATRVRAAVAAFDERSLRLCVSAGFCTARGFDGPGGRPFVERVLDLPA